MVRRMKTGEGRKEKRGGRRKNKRKEIKVREEVVRLMEKARKVYESKGSSVDENEHRRMRVKYGFIT